MEIGAGLKGADPLFFDTFIMTIGGRSKLRIWLELCAQFVRSTLAAYPDDPRWPKILSFLLGRDVVTICLEPSSIFINRQILSQECLWDVLRVLMVRKEEEEDPHHTVWFLIFFT